MVRPRNATDRFLAGPLFTAPALWDGDQAAYVMTAEDRMALGAFATVARFQIGRAHV